MTTWLQREVLHVLDEHGEMTVREVADVIGRNPRSVRSVLLILNGKGLVKRRLNGPPTTWRLT